MESTFDTINLILTRPSILGNESWSIQWKDYKNKNYFIGQNLVTRVFPEYSNVEDSCPMIIDDETKTEPQELTFAQKLQVRLDEARF